MSIHIYLILQFIFDFLSTNSILSYCRFSKIHAFEKPNDENALRLMNSCATAMLEKFPDIVFAYGVSDEYRYAVLS
jgi:tRNA(His) 5'-end guanylyltransferase